MFIFDNNMKKEEKKYKDNKFVEKPKFKELVSIMLSQYLIILPIVFGIMIVFMFIVKLLLFIWGR